MVSTKVADGMFFTYFNVPTLWQLERRRAMNSIIDSIKIPVRSRPDYHTQPEGELKFAIDGFVLEEEPGIQYVIKNEKKYKINWEIPSIEEVKDESNQ